MKYLVVFDGDRLAGSKPMRGEFATWNYDTIRRFLAEVYPGHVVASPLEAMPPCGRAVAVWSSPNKDGVGRTENGFQEWAVAPEKPC